jgi:hypothetical protein
MKGNPMTDISSTRQTVTPETFIRAETDRMFHEFVKNAGGGINDFYYLREPTPLDEQSVVRMNRDTLYQAAVIDTEGEAFINFPELDEGRYASIELVDNDHYVPCVIYEPGRHKLPQDTKYLAVMVRIQLFDTSSEKEIKHVNDLQDQFTVEVESADPMPPFQWDDESLDNLRAQYEEESAEYSSYKGMQGPRGEVDEETRHIAAAAAWGLLPEWDATYLNYSGGHDPAVCHFATYEVPENEAFWSITVYDSEGFIESENSIIRASNVVFNDDGTFTVYYGPAEACGEVPNRLDVTEGWNFLMRIYRPGESVLDGKYQLPEAVPVDQT